MEYLLIALYFLIPTIFYLYTKKIYKKYNKKVSWCDNVVKIKKIYLVQIPLLLMWGITTYLFVSINILFSSQTIISYLAIANLVLFALWIITISPYAQTQIIHPLIGTIYIVMYILLAFFSIKSIVDIVVFTVALVLVGLVIINFLKNKNLNTKQEELLMIVFLLLMGLLSL